MAKSSNQLVMLAHVYEEKRVTYPCYVQPKLNGIRAYYRKGNLYSRDRKLLQAATHIAKALELLKLPENVILDGELYKHEWPLSRINAAIGVNRETIIEDTLQIGFCIFDLIQDGATFKDRMAYLLCAVRPVLPTCATIVEPMICLSKDHADALYQGFTKMGFEGIMYRVGGCLYHKGKRSYALLKRKDWKDDWFPIADKYEGKRTELGSRLVGTLGGFTCLLPNGKTFDVGSGFTDKERADIWDGKTIVQEVHVRYECLSEDGIPLKPTAIEWR